MPLAWIEVSTDVLLVVWGISALESKGALLIPLHSFRCTSMCGGGVSGSTWGCKDLHPRAADAVPLTSSLGLQTAALHNFSGFKSESALALGQTQNLSLAARVAAQATTVSRGLQTPLAALPLLTCC